MKSPELAPLPTAAAVAGDKVHRDSMATSWPSIKGICGSINIMFNREQDEILAAALAYKRHEIGARAAAATWPKVRQYCLSAGARLSVEQSAGLQLALTFRSATGR